MKRILLVLLFAIIAIVPSWGQDCPHTNLYVSTHYVCQGEPVNFIDEGNNRLVLRREWRFEDTIIYGEFAGDQLSVTRTFENKINPVKLIVYYDTFTLNGLTPDTVWCCDSIMDTVIVFTHPRITGQGDYIVCPGQATNILITPTVEGCAYEWFDNKGVEGDSIVAQGTRLTVEPRSDSAIYYVRIYDGEHCYLWDSVRTFIVQPTLNTLPEDGRICEGAPAYLRAGKAAYYRWGSFPFDTSLAKVDSSKSTIEIHPKSTTIYSVIAYGSNGCAVEQKEASINVSPVPVIDYKVSPAFIDPENPTVTFTNLSTNCNSTYWFFDGVANLEGSPAEYTFPELTRDSLMVTLRASNDFGCMAEEVFRLPIQRFASWPALLFTPNRAENNTFKLPTVNHLEYFSVYIYDRRGALVFESNDPEFEWDGSHKGVNCKQGVYVYITRYRRAGTGDLMMKKGEILLVR